MNLLERIRGEHIIPVVEIDSANSAAPLVEAVLAGGINILEITLRTPEAVEAISAIRSRFPEMLVGAGTVTDLEQSAQVRDAGAQFGVSPGLNPDIVHSFQSEGLPFIPGVMTPMEIEFAITSGCSLLKFFPAGAAGGPPFLKALSGPYAVRGISFCATGGITLDNMNQYLQLPLVSAIGGSWLASRQQIAEKQWEQITQQVSEAKQKLAEIHSATPPGE